MARGGYSSGGHEKFGSIGGEGSIVAGWSIPKPPQQPGVDPTVLTSTAIEQSENSTYTVSDYLIFPTGFAV